MVRSVLNIRWLASSGLVLVLLLGGCGGSRTPYEPKTAGPTAAVDRLVSRLEHAINSENAARVCVLYAYPARRCKTIWRHRIDVLPLPIDLDATKLTFGCAGDVRVSLAKRRSPGDRLGTLTFVTPAEGAEPLLIDVAFETRLSSLVLPRYNGCADFEDGSAGAPNLDQATSLGANVP